MTSGSKIPESLQWLSPQQTQPLEEEVVPHPLCSTDGLSRANRLEHPASAAGEGGGEFPSDNREPGGGVPSGNREPTTAVLGEEKQNK